MSDLLRLALTLLAPAVALPTTRRSPARIVAVIAAAATTALLGVATLATAAAALWIWTEQWIGPVGAPAIVAGGLLVLTLVAAASAHRLARPSAIVSAPPDTASTDRLLEEAARLVRTHKTPILLAALLAGLAAGRDRT